MIFLQFWWTLMVLSGTNMLPAESQQPSSQQLTCFNRAVKEARDKMQDLDGLDSLYRPPRHTIDDMLASFAHTSNEEEPEDQSMAEAADAWYRDFRAGLADGQKQPRAVGKQKSKNYVSKYFKELQDTEMGKVKLKYKDTAVEPIIPEFEVTSVPFQYDGGGLSSLDIKLKHAQEILNEHEKNGKKDPYRLKEYHKKADVNDALPEFGDAPVPDGIYEKTLSQLDAPKRRPNNLQHEANYKLSKIEQDASENAQRPARPKGSDLKKRSSHFGFNPMHEIKLKTSNRLMLKGMGPSLPSNALIDHQHSRLVDELMKRRHLNMRREQQQQRQDQDLDSDLDPEQSQESDTSDVDVRRQQFDGFSPLSDNMMQFPGDTSFDEQHMMDLPQSYDYRMPPYDRFHALSQRQMPHMGDYLSSNRRSAGDLGRYKREHVPEKSPETVAKVAVKECGPKPEQLDITGVVSALKEEAKPEVEEQHDGEISGGKRQAEKEPIEGSVVEKSTDSGKVQVEAEAKPSEAAKVETDIELKPTEAAIVRVASGESNLQPEVADIAQDSPVRVDSAEVKSTSETDGSSDAEASLETHDKTKSHLIPQSELEQSQILEKPQPAASMEDSALQESTKLNVEESVTSRPAEMVPKPESVQAAAPTPLLTNPDAVVKLLAKELSQHGGDKDRHKRHLHRRRHRWSPRKKHRSKRSTGEEPQPPESHERAKRMAAPLLDDFEDHNGNRLRFGDLGNGLLMPDAVEEELEDDPHIEENEASLYDGSSVQLPMMNQRANGVYQVTQQPLQMQQLQQQQQQQQYPQQQQQQQLQMIHPQPNFKATFNLTNFFNELQKLQKSRPPQQQQIRPVQQQQQQQQQQQEQRQQQQLPVQHQYLPQQQYLPQKTYLPQKQYVPKQQYIPQQQKTPLQIQQKQPQMKFQAPPPPMKQSAVHRYFGPFFNKQVKSNVLSTVDPCITPMEAPPLPITVDPNCVSITSPLPGASTESTTPGLGESTTAMPSMTNTTDATANGTISGGADATPLGVGDNGTTTSGPAMPSDDFCNSPDALKLNVSINANVCGDPKTKQFYGNGSINMQPAFDEMDTDLMLDWPEHGVHDDLLMENDDRYAREASINWNGDAETDKRSPKKFNRRGKAQVKEKSSSKCSLSADSCEDSLEKLITGKTSEAIVSAVLEAVSNDPGMDRLLAVLERNRKGCHKKPKNFYQIRNDKNEQYLQQTETMVRDTMEAISDIIDKQVRLRSCIPLRPDLSEFYDLILKTLDEQKKSREKRENSVSGLADDFSEDVRLLDANKIDARSRIVKKLLRQYEELPLEDQRAAANVRDELLMDLMYLRKMADTVERTQRSAKLQEVLRQTSLTNGLQSRMSGELSPRFIKLVKTAELFKEAGEQQARAFVGHQ